MSAEAHLAIWFIGITSGVILLGSFLSYVKDLIMEKVNDWKMVKEEIEEEKDTLKTSIKEIEDA